MANENERMESPPRMKIASNTINVETDVLMVRARVSLIESLNNFCLSPLGCKRRFSRIRSNTTTESLMS